MVISVTEAQKLTDMAIDEQLKLVFEKITEVAHSGKFSLRMVFQLTTEQKRRLEDLGYTVQYDKFDSTIYIFWR